MPNIITIRVILLSKCGWGINTIILIMIDNTCDKSQRKIQDSTSETENVVTFH